MTVYLTNKENNNTMVENPPHYIDGGIETIDILDAKLNEKQFEGYLLGNVFKYICRYGKKGDCFDALQDLEKAQFYLKKIIFILKKKYTKKG
tara:strand:+ start:4430 stop:4705 length:276 start_codon:yes stop_codon:yes gene_type:complete